MTLREPTTKDRAKAMTDAIQHTLDRIAENLQCKGLTRAQAVEAAAVGVLLAVRRHAQVITGEA